MSENRPSLVRRIFTALALFLFLVVFPLGSYLYLKKGYDYQKAALSDLRKTHRLTNYDQLQLLDGELAEGGLQGSMYLLGLMPSASQTEVSRYGKLLFKLHDQFNHADNLQIWSLFEQQDSAFTTNFQLQHELPNDSTQLLYWTAAERDWGGFLAQLGLTPEEESTLDKGAFVLVDDSLYVRRAYALADDEQIRQLVERTAILLPERGKPDPEVRRKQEY
ncbi:MAG: hypothetical protein AAGJ82_16075 [Bacteroidota bacterium]